MRTLLDAKLAGQAAVIAGWPAGPDAAETITELRRALRTASDVDTCRLLEAAAAARYWQVMASVPVRFGPRDRASVPAGWRTFGTRSSPLSGGPRRAVTPANAMLNYLYAIAEAETRLAALAVGLDPGLGVLHADLRARDSLALDLLEAIRPDVDRFLLDVLAQRTFGARDFGERPDGTVRVAAPLAAALAATGARWRAAVGPWADHVASVLLADSGMPVPTPLTEDHRSAGRIGQRRGPRRRPAPGQLRLPTACGRCGEPAADGRTTCSTCLPEARSAGRASFQRAGPAAIARLRAAGRDPTHGGSAAARRGATQTARLREQLAWQGPPADPAAFAADVLPAIAGGGEAAAGSEPEGGGAEEPPRAGAAEPLGAGR